MKKIICSKCGEIINNDDYETIDGDYVCRDCVEGYYTKCEDCGAWIENDEAYWIEDEQKYVCDDCIDNYSRCEDCGNYYYNTRYVENVGNICDSCFDRGNYGYCDDCDNYFSMDDLYYSEHNDCYYCSNCYSEHTEGLLYDYHEFNDWHFYKGQNEENAPYYIGKEIELEPKGWNNNNLRNIINAMDNNINAVGMEDGSLNSDSIEVVTHPESWQYLLEHKENYRRFFEEVENYNYGDDGHTGLHFHVSRPSEDVVSRIIVILESFKNEIKKLSRRNGETRWSAFITDTTGDDTLEKIKYQSIKYIKDKYIKDYHERYMALNLCNRNTIEFRFFKGANNFEEFWGALQFIHNIMEVALDEKRDINTITWKELLYGDELTEQAKKLEVLDIDKNAKDTTEIMEKLEKAKEDTKNEIKKTLKNFIKYISKEMEEKRLEILNRNDVNEIENNSRKFLDTLSNDLNYLSRLTNLYREVDYSSFNTIKSDVKYIKSRTISKDKYSRYFKKIDKTIEKLESEVLG